MIPAAFRAWLSCSAPPGYLRLCPRGWTPSGPTVTASSPTLAPSMRSSLFVSGFAAPAVQVVTERLVPEAIVSSPSPNRKPSPMDTPVTRAPPASMLPAAVETTRDTGLSGPPKVIDCAAILHAPSPPFLSARSTA